PRSLSARLIAVLRCSLSSIRAAPQNDVRRGWTRRLGYPDRMGSRRDRDSGFPGGGASIGGKQSGGLIPVRGPQALARPVEVGVDGVLRDAELACDLLGTEVLDDQAQAFALARGQELEPLLWLDVRRPHGSKLSGSR